MAKWGNEYDENTSLNDLKMQPKEESEVAETEEEEKARLQEEKDEAALDAETKKKAEEAAADGNEGDEEVKEDPDKKDEEVKEDPDGIIDIEAEEEAEKERIKKAEEEAAAAKAKADESKTEEELAQEKKDADEKAAQDEADSKAEAEKKAKEDQDQVPETFEIKIGEETYDAKRAEESIKKLNAIEGDEFLKNLIEHRTNGGEVLDYLKANNTSEDDMSNLELARYAFDNDSANTGLGKEDLDLLWETELESRYKLKNDDESELTEKDKKLGEVKLKRDAEKAKSLIKKNKENFKIAKPKTEVAQELVQSEIEKAKNEQAAAQAESLKEWNTEVDDHEVTKTLREKGMVVIEVDGRKVGYKPKDPEGLIDINKDLNKFLATATDKDGHIILSDFNEIMAFAQDKSKFKSDLVKLGMMKERKNNISGNKPTKDKTDKNEKADQANENKEGMSKTMASLKNASWGGL